MRKAILIGILFLSPALLFAQQKSTPAKKSPPPPPSIKGCHLPTDSVSDNALPLDDIKAWADAKSLEVRCGKAVYTLVQFNISVIKQNPMQTLDFGTGNGGIPILARKAIDQMGPLDTILMRDVTAKDANGKEVKLSTIVFKVEAAATPEVKTEDKTTTPATPQN